MSVFGGLKLILWVVDGSFAAVQYAFLPLFVPPMD